MKPTFIIVNVWPPKRVPRERYVKSWVYKVPIMNVGLEEVKGDGKRTRKARPPYTFSYLHASRPMGDGSTTDKSV